MEVTDVGEFLRYYEGIRGRTRRVAVCVPDDSLEWRPSPGQFSFGDLLRHLGAMERYMFAENAAGRPSRYPGHSPDLVGESERVIDYFDRMHTESIEIFASLRKEDLQGRCTTPAGATMSVGKWLRAMVEHEVHHRGQLYLMLGLLRIPTPPIFGLTSEEVLRRSGLTTD